MDNRHGVHPYLTEGKKSGRLFQFPSNIVDIRHGPLGSQTTSVDENLDDDIPVFVFDEVIDGSGYLGLSDPTLLHHFLTRRDGLFHVGRIDWFDFSLGFRGFGFGINIDSVFG